MIYSRQLISEEPQRGEYPLGLRPTPKYTPAPTPKTVKIVKTVDTPFGSVYSNVKLDAICTKTDEIVDSLTYRCNTWEVETATKLVKQTEFATNLKEKGYEIT